METTVIYTIKKTTDFAEFFTDLELLWKSFVFSYHAVSGECKRKDLLMFIDPNGNEYPVRVCYLYREVTHL